MGKECEVKYNGKWYKAVRCTDSDVCYYMIKGHILLEKDLENVIIKINSHEKGLEMDQET